MNIYNQDHQQQVVQRINSVMDIPDLANLVADYCDDESILKLSRVSKEIRKVTIVDNKVRYIRLIEYKYSHVCDLLEQIVFKIQSGQLIDLEMFVNDEKKTLLEEQTDRYRKNIANKYPDNTYKSYLKLNKNIEKFISKQKKMTSIDCQMYQPTTGLDATMQYATETSQLYTRKPYLNKMYPEDEIQSLLLDDSVYASLQQRKIEYVQQYQAELQKFNELDRQAFELMDKFNDKNTSLKEIVDGYANYNISRIKQKLDNTFKKIKGEVYCDSDIIMRDHMESQYFYDSITEKVLDARDTLIEPFKQTYVLEEIKNALIDRLGNPQDQTRMYNVDESIRNKPFDRQYYNRNQQELANADKKFFDKTELMFLEDQKQFCVTMKGLIDTDREQIKNLPMSSQIDQPPQVARNSPFNEQNNPLQKKKKQSWKDLIFHPPCQKLFQMKIDPVSLQFQHLLSKKRGGL